MPELPEVETTLRGILPHVKYQTITKIIIRQSQLRWPIPLDIENKLSNKTISNIERRGKYLLLKTANSGTLLIHLGMSGHLRILTKKIPPNKHDHVDILFRNKKILRFTDPRRFGALLWAENPYTHTLLKNLGPEPLSKNFSGKYLWTKAQGKTIAIKSFLMDNKIVTGIGNIYATEALFKASIHPTAQAGSLSLERMQILTLCIKKILRQAIQRGGTTLKDFLNSQGKAGYFSQYLQVYGREKLLCFRCNLQLQALKISQRNTVFCPHCQLL